jgi:hypothetical protein
MCIHPTGHAVTTSPFTRPRLLPLSARALFLKCVDIALHTNRPVFLPRMDSSQNTGCSDLQAALFGGGGAGGLARSLHLLQRYVLQSQQNTADDDCAAAAATTTAIETLCTHFLSCVTPNTSAQQLLISAVAAYILPFPAVAATCQRLSFNFAHRNHAITWVHTVMACLQSSPPPPPPSHGGRASMQLLIHQLLQVLQPCVPVSLSP